MKFRNLAVVLLLVLLLGVSVQAAETDYTAAGGYMQLSEDMKASWSLTEDLYVDLNGYDLSGTIVTNGYAVYGMDSTSAYYSSNKLTVVALYDDGIYARDLFAEYIEENY